MSTMTQQFKNYGHIRHHSILPQFGYYSRTALVSKTVVSYVHAVCHSMSSELAGACTTIQVIVRAAFILLGIRQISVPIVVRDHLAVMFRCDYLRSPRNQSDIAQIIPGGQKSHVENSESLCQCINVSMSVSVDTNIDVKPKSNLRFDCNSVHLFNIINYV